MAFSLSGQPDFCVLTSQFAAYGFHHELMISALRQSRNSYGSNHARACNCNRKRPSVSRKFRQNQPDSRFGTGVFGCENPRRLDPVQFLLIATAGWINPRQQQTIEYLREENRVLREQLGERRLRFNVCRTAHWFASPRVSIHDSRCLSRLQGYRCCSINLDTFCLSTMKVPVST